MSDNQKIKISELKKFKFLHPLIALLMAAPIKIPFEILQDILKLESIELVRQLKMIEDLLVVTKNNENEIQYCLLKDDYQDFLAESKKSKLKIDIINAHLLLAEYCFGMYKIVDDFKELFRPYFLLDQYILYALPHHL